MRKTTRRFGPAIAALAILGGYLVVASGTAGAGRPLARATIRNADNVAIGTVVFKGEGHYAERVEVELDLPSTATGLGSYHGLHIHSVGECTAPSFGSAGGHWNPDAVGHGSHDGDLPSVLVSLDGEAYAEFETHRINIEDVDGLAVIFHNGVDNFGNVPLASDRYQDATDWYHNVTPPGTYFTGDAGTRYGCGVIEATA